MPKQVKFFDSLQTQSVLSNCVEDFFFYGRLFKHWKFKEYELSYPHANLKQRVYARRTDKICLLAYDVLKALSCMTGIVPFFMFVGKCCYRHSLKSITVKSKTRPKKPQKAIRKKRKVSKIFIPNDVISHIIELSLLDLNLKKQLCRLAEYSRVSKSFHDISRTKILNRLDTHAHSNLARLFPSVNGYVNYIEAVRHDKLTLWGEDLKEVTKLPKSIKSLILRYSSNETLGSFFASFTDYENLDLQHLQVKVSNEVLDVICPKIFQVKSLNIKGVFCNPGRLISSTTDLKVLNAAECVFLTDTITQLFPKMNGLTYLDISNSTILEEDTLIQLTGELTNLTTLKCDGLSFFTDQVCASISENLSKLLFLSLNQCECVSKDGIEILAKRLNFLEALSMLKVNIPSEVLLRGFFNLKKLKVDSITAEVIKTHPLLKTLVVQEEIEEGVLETIVQTCVDLKKLELKVQLTKSELQAIAEHIKNLETLVVDDIEESEAHPVLNLSRFEVASNGGLHPSITKIDAQNLDKKSLFKFKKLTYVILTDTKEHLSADFISFLFENFPRLKVIHFKGCKNLTVDSVDVLEEQGINLEYIRVPIHSLNLFNKAITKLKGVGLVRVYHLEENFFYY